MKRSKGIGPHNLGVSKTAVKKVHSDTMAYKIGMGAETNGGAMTKQTNKNNKIKDAVKDVALNAVTGGIYGAAKGVKNLFSKNNDSEPTGFSKKVKDIKKQDIPEGKGLNIHGELYNLNKSAKSMVNKNNYGNSESMANASKYYAMLNDNMEKFGMSSEEAGIKAAKDIKKEK